MAPMNRARARWPQRLVKALGPDAERVDLDAGRVASDPAILADEAASVSLFGGARYIRVEAVTDACLPGIEALLEAPAAGNPVLLIGGALKKDAKIVKRIDGDAAAMLFASYPPEGVDADRLAVQLAREQGLEARCGPRAAAGRRIGRRSRGARLARSRSSRSMPTLQPGSRARPPTT